jgi:hypothetical protein
MKNTLNLIILTLLSFTIQAQCIKGDCNNGRGKYEINADKTFTGDFKNSKPHGKGRIDFSNGMVVKGFWKAGLQDGKCIVESPNGSKLLCYYKQGKKHGKGKQLDPNRKPIAFYEWNNGKLVSKKEVTASNTTSNVLASNKTETEQASEEENSSQANTMTEEPVVKKSLNIGEMVHMTETYSYNTGDGSFFGNLMGSVLKVSFHIDFFGIVESKLGDRYKVTITDALIDNPSWASMNYYKYKPYAQSDANKKIGQTIFVYPDEVNTAVE